MHQGSKDSRAGFTLVEVVLSTLIVSLMLVGALTAVGASAAGRQVIADRSRGAMLAQELAEEIISCHYADPDDPNHFGPEADEAGRADFDDVDDFREWSASPPVGPDGQARPYLDGWTRSVRVARVGTLSDSAQVSASDQGMRQIVVTVTRRDKPVAQVTVWRGDGH
jgi:type II secretory pathway pseudopilin PulG